MITALPRNIVRLYGTRSRDFKAAKRQEFDEFVRGFKDFQLACAYTPGYDEFNENLEEAMTNWRVAMNVKNWGR